MLSADCTARFRPSSSKRFVVARAVLPSNATRIDADSFTSATFWWIVLLAKRVSEKSVEEKITSTSSTVENLFTFSKICSALLWSSIHVFLRASASPRCNQFPLYAVPIFTFLNRAGDAPCPVPIVCIGCPLPQFGVPHRVH